VSTEIVPTNETTLQPAALELQAIAADVLLARMQAVDKVMKEVMKPGIHYGAVAPGVPGNMLYKAGTEVLAAAFQLALEYDVRTDVSDDGRRYIATCRVTHQPTGAFLGSGVGECSTAETKYKWRSAHKKEYDATAPDRRREKLTKRGERYYQVREETDDKANTALKMACKRAAADAIPAVLGVRGSVLLGDQSDAAEQTAAARVGDEAIASLLRIAAVKGTDEAGLLKAAAKHHQYRGKLADVPAPLYGWMIEQLLTLPDKVDPISGEVVDVDPDSEAARADSEPPGMSAEQYAASRDDGPSDGAIF
jgi:hypothetical protein